MTALRATSAVAHHDYEARDSAATGFEMYACPACKGRLTLRDGVLACSACAVIYPIVDGIPDFITEDLTRSASSVLRGFRRVDLLARVYESKWWYPLVINVYAGFRATSLPELVQIVGDIVQTDGRLILDVACGPGTLGRRVASPGQEVYGVDMSMGMLREGVVLAQREGRGNVHFARGQVEALPFGPGLFDAGICGGALHLFHDTVAALQEIGRVMKPGAALAVTTFVAGRSGVFRFRRVREHVRSDHGLRVFELPELESYLAQAGFERFEPRLFGSLAVFKAVKR